MNQLPKLNIAFCSEEYGDVFLLERKAMNNHKERWNTFSTHSEWNFLLPRAGMAGHSSVYESGFQTLNSTWLKEMWWLQAFCCNSPFGKKYGFPLFPLAVLPLPQFIKRMQNEINRSRGRMKSLKLKESQHQRVYPSSSLNPFYNSGCYDNMMQLYITMTIWHNFQKTVSTVLFCCSIAPKETCCYLLLWWKLY